MGCYYYIALLGWSSKLFSIFFNPKAHERFQALSNESGLGTGGLGGTGLAFTSNAQLNCLSQVFQINSLKSSNAFRNGQVPHR